MYNKIETLFNLRIKVGESDLDEAELLIPPAGRGACSARVSIHSAAACKISVCIIMIVNIDCLS